MSERESSEFDEHGAPPRPSGSDSGAPPSGPLPLHPRGDGLSSRTPVFDADKWPTSAPQADPTGGHQVPPVEPPMSGLAPMPRPGAQRSSPADSESTSIVDRDWLATQMQQQSAEEGRDLSQETTPYGDPGQLTTPYDRTKPVPGSQFGDPPAAFGGPGRGTRVPRPGEAGRPGPSWQQPQQPPPGAWPQHQGASPRGGEPQPPGMPEWSGAQGSAGNWSYVDSIRSSELVPTRRIPPGRGWRKVFYYSTFKLINPGQSPDERYQAQLEAKVRSLLRGTYKIAVLGKGGVGKSTVSAGVGSIFAELRQDDRVVAVDADTAFGKLAARIDPRASGSYWELAGDRNLNTFADMRSRVGSNPVGLFVLGGAPETARRRVLDPAIYRAATDQLNRHFTLSIVDCGSTMDSTVTREVLSDVDALIVVSSPWFDGASAAGQTLEWLANGGYTALLHRTVVVVNDSDGHAGKRDLKLLVERFGSLGQKVIQLPYDRHLRPGGVIDVRNDVDPLTRRRMLELAAECAEHFGSTSDRPRRAGAANPPQGPGSRRPSTEGADDRDRR